MIPDTDNDTLLKFLKDHPPPGTVLFAKIAGSRCHNLNLSTSDSDFAGVFVASTQDVLSLDWSSSKETMTYDSEDAGRDKKDIPDHTFHEVGKFCALLMKGNPGIMEHLWTSQWPSCALWEPAWTELRGERKKFLCSHSVGQYLGYINGQLTRLQKDMKKKKDVQEGRHAYKEKWVYHILRLAEDARRIASGDEPLIWWLDSPERDHLMKVRNYEFSWEECEKMIVDAVQKVEALKPFKLPEFGDKALLNDWLLRIRKKNW